MKTIQAHWLVSLSNGETAIEGKPPFEEIAGEQSPWLKLLLYLAKNKLTITNIRIQIEKEGEAIKTFNLPSTSPRQKWIYSFTDQNNNSLLICPLRFNYFRRVIKDSNPDVAEEHYIEIHAIYNGFTLVTIVDEDTGNESWSLVVANQEGEKVRIN